MSDRDEERSKEGGGRGRHGHKGQSSSEPPAKHPLVKLAEAVQKLQREDERVGFPKYRPHVDKPETFGWLFAAQKILLHHIMREDTRVVVQIGAYLGKTTLFIRERSPNALIFVLDEWDNESLKAEPSLNKNYENIDLFERVPFHEMFLYNLWDHQAKDAGKDGRMAGIVPMRMGWREGFRLLEELGVRPDALYWEGYPPTTKEVEELIEKCQKTFRGVTIVGDGFSIKEVRQGVLNKKSLFHEKRPYVELGKCWTYARIKEHELAEPRDLYYHQTENKAGQSVLAMEEEVEETDDQGKKVVKKVTLGQKSFADLLSSFKSVSSAKKEEDAEERFRRRRQEEEERERRRREQAEREEAEEEEERRKRRPRSRSPPKVASVGGGQKRPRSEGGVAGEKRKRQDEQWNGEEVPHHGLTHRPAAGLLPTPTPEQLAAIAAKKAAAEAERKNHAAQHQEEDEGRGWM